MTIIMEQHPRGLDHQQLQQQGSQSQQQQQQQQCLQQPHQDQGYPATPSLSEAILETDFFLRSFGIKDEKTGTNTNNDQYKMDIDFSTMEFPAASTAAPGFHPDYATSTASQACGGPYYSTAFGNCAGQAFHAPQQGQGPGCLLPPITAITALSTTTSTPILTTAHEVLPVASSSVTSEAINIKYSPNQTPTNITPVVTPKMASPPTDNGSRLDLTSNLDLTFIDQFVGQKLMQESNHHQYQDPAAASAAMMAAAAASTASNSASRLTSSTFRNLFTSNSALDPIPECKETDSPATFQPLVPPAIPRPVTTSYNISFPTTLQPRDRFDVWRSSNLTPLTINPGSSRYSSGTGSSCSSHHSPGSSVTSPFHDAKSSDNPIDVSEFQPLNVIEDSTSVISRGSSGYSSKSGSGSSSRGSTSATSYKSKPSKRSRTNSPNRDENSEASDGASSRQRRKSNNSGESSAASTTSAASAVLVSTMSPLAGASGVSGTTSTTESKRRDNIKCGLEDLQRLLPQYGAPEEEKVSQATILYEASKYLKSLKQTQSEGASAVEKLDKEIEELNTQIDQLQSQLPDNGALFAVDHKSSSLVAAKKSLPDQFHDHVVERTHENWRYWVFTSIMGHFVHSFGEEVSAVSHHDLQTTSLEWITNAMSLQQLRKDASRKLAKLCAKTSISEDPSKLPEEALKFVSSSASRRQNRHPRAS